MPADPCVSSNVITMTITLLIIAIIIISLWSAPLFWPGNISTGIFVIHATLHVKTHRWWAYRAVIHLSNAGNIEMTKLYWLHKPNACNGIVYSSHISLLLGSGYLNLSYSICLEYIFTKHIFTRPIFLTHWDRDEIDAISQTTFSNAFSWMKMNEFRVGFHWSLFLRFELTIFRHWFR